MSTDLAIIRRKRRELHRKQRTLEREQRARMEEAEEQKNFAKAAPTKGSASALTLKEPPSDANVVKATPKPQNIYDKHIQNREGSGNAASKDGRRKKAPALLSTPRTKFHGTAGIPTKVGSPSLYSKASPSSISSPGYGSTGGSAVSSLEVAVGQNKPKRKRSLYYDSDSSEGEDMVQIALRLQREKQKTKEQQVKNKVAAKNNIGPGKTIRKNPSLEEGAIAAPVKRSSCYLDDVDEVDMVKLSMKLEKQRNLDNFRPGTLPQHHTTGMDSVMHSTPEAAPTTKSPASAATASSGKKRARNPLALMKQENKATMFPSLQATTFGDACTRTNVKPAAAASLWSDSEEEEKEPLVRDSPKKRKRKKDLDGSAEKRKKGTSTRNNGMQPNSQIPLSPQGNASTNHRVPQMNFDDDQEAEVSLPELSEKKKRQLQLQLKPEFEYPKFGPFEPAEPLQLIMNDNIDNKGSGTDDDSKKKDDSTEAVEVPASVNRYLPEYQKEGIRFMYKALIQKGGAILGDDMGLGKTVQMISLLAALFKKSGTGLDLFEIEQRRRKMSKRLATIQAARQQTLRSGQVFVQSSAGISAAPVTVLPTWVPVLVVVPPSVAEHWMRDFATWGHFAVSLYTSGSNREEELEKIRQGTAEVLICARSLFAQNSDFGYLSDINWKLIVVDEYHVFKNPESILSQNLRKFRNKQQCGVIGLTGTPFQNNHKELWNLVDMVVEDYFGEWEDYKEAVENPIKYARTNDATSTMVKLGLNAGEESSKLLYDLYIARKKEDVLMDHLPMKDERIVFCEPSDLQKQLYKHILKQPDFLLLIQANAPCDCGINQKFFLEYQHLASKAEKIEYQRRNKNEIIKRGKCCYKIPHDRDSPDGIDPSAIMWRHTHKDGIECKQCPTCILFNALHVLYKLSSHVALLQLKESPEKYSVGSKKRAHIMVELERAKVFIPKELLSKLPGKSYVREDSIMDDHFNLSGKMKVLDKLLRAISAQQGRVLLFSTSTQMLDLIQNYIRSEGYSHLRMDGSTHTKRRQEMADEFKHNSAIFVFLLSTKAMGMGLNLVEANYVIIFDVDWNPTNDAQAQDRAYRIGQTKDVKVFRLVSRGTIEEMKYLRQVYKTQLKSETIVDFGNSKRASSARLFRGVEGDTTRKGELFGLANLLKFKDGTFMNYSVSQSKTDSQRYGDGIHRTENLLDSVKDLSEEDFDAIGNEQDCFHDIALRTERDDEDNKDPDDTAIGGESQVVLDICDHVNLPEIDASPDSSEKETKPLPTILEQGEDKTLLNTTQSAGTPAKNEEKDHNTVNPSSPREAEPAASTPITKPSVEKTPPSTPLPTASAAEKTPPSILSQAESIEKAPQPRNMLIVGKSWKKVKDGKAGKTTFSAKDFYLPGQKRRSKKKK